MDLKIEVNPEQIEQHVTKAIVESAFGKRLHDAIDKALKDLGSSYGWQDRLGEYVKQEMWAIARQEIEKNYGEQIRQKIREQLTEDVLSKAVEHVTSKTVNTMRLDPY